MPMCPCGTRCGHGAAGDRGTMRRRNDPPARCSPRDFSSEFELHRDLHDARVAGRGYLIEGRRYEMVEAQQMGFVWLKVLKVSQRNCPENRSENLMFLNNERSVFQKPGARMAPGRSVVSVVCVAVGTANAAALNQLWKDCGDRRSWDRRPDSGGSPKVMPQAGSPSQLDRCSCTSSRSMCRYPRLR